MQTQAAVLRRTPGEFESAQLELEAPRHGEIMVRMVSAGLCHSDDHIAVGDLPVEILPMCGGHEGAGIVERVGPDTSGFEVGDHVVLTFIPACGRCPWCAQGKQELCDRGANALRGSRFDDPNSFRMQLSGLPCAQSLGVSTFSQYTTVSVSSAIKVPPDVPLSQLCLLGCAIGTGWGSAINAANVRPGHTVIVMGMGGIGTAAVQGAAHAGASNVIVVDPVAFKRSMAQHFGATEAVATIDEAAERARHYTNGQGADSTIVSVGRVQAKDLTDAVDSIRKGGIVALTAMGTFIPEPVDLNLGLISMFQKTITGVVYGNWSPFLSIPTMIRLYRTGQLNLDDMVTKTYTLDQVAQGFRDMKVGNSIRGVIDFA